ncbi:MAG: DUF4301 family protein [Bacteroidales bacterium]|jgi:hypothetical protein
MSLSASDIQQINNHGLTVDDVEMQIMNFITGFPYVKLLAPAIKGNGIMELSEKEIEEKILYYENNSSKHQILKFVPASGAATRMFKDLLEFSGLYMGLKYTLKEFPSAEKTIENLSKFAFYDELKTKFNSHSVDIDEYLSNGNYTNIVNYILTEIGLNYGKSPKAFITFHKYENEERQYRCALEEHFVEAANYSKQEDGVVNIHFTVSPEHKQGFEEIIEKIKPVYERRFNVKYNVSFSIQKESTDTIAVNQDNTLVYDKEGNIVFRPSGHGALIENLNDIKGDIIFIKNIDNVAHDKIKSYTYKYKKLIGGVLLQIQEEVFSALKALEKKGSLNSQEVVDIIVLTNKIGINLTDKERNQDNILEIIFNKLNRPIRVCGMVRNQGEPGGGPFWIEKNGEKSFQIIESAQVNLRDESQKEIFSSSTHFNPVDLVCGVKSYNGSNFDLKQYIDNQTGFISTKSKDGKLIKAQELPGLWNGSMADWITIFVEVPLETFTPVKVVNDLLRDEHQG